MVTGTDAAVANGGTPVLCSAAPWRSSASPRLTHARYAPMWVAGKTPPRMPLKSAPRAEYALVEEMIQTFVEALAYITPWVTLYDAAGADTDLCADGLSHGVCIAPGAIGGPSSYSAFGALCVVWVAAAIVVRYLDMGMWSSCRWCAAGWTCAGETRRRRIPMVCAQAGGVYGAGISTAVCSAMNRHGCFSWCGLCGRCGQTCPVFAAGGIADAVRITAVIADCCGQLIGLCC